jgi:hypothetical protein
MLSTGPKYYVPDADGVARAKASRCPLATPQAPWDKCTGRSCFSFNHAENRPCDEFVKRDEVQTAARFWGAYLISSMTPGMSAVQLG